MAPSPTLSSPNRPNALAGLVDPNHTYMFKSDEFCLFSYWYKDRAGNYWRYTNAPENTSDYDPLNGPPILDPTQVMPATAPEFYTEGGVKLNQAVPDDVDMLPNDGYDAYARNACWVGAYFDAKTESIRYVYADTDTKENPFLLVQQLIRTTASRLKPFRTTVADLLESIDVKDRVIGAALMLCDQGFFSPEQVCSLVASDVVVLDNSLTIAGRKFVVDEAVGNLIRSLSMSSQPSDPLFQTSTSMGPVALGTGVLGAYFSYLKMSPNGLLLWHVSNLYSKLFNMYANLGLPYLDLDLQTLERVRLAVGSDDDIEGWVLPQIREFLAQAYGATTAKGLSVSMQDEYGVPVLRSDFRSLNGDELEFSMWLRTQPMHYPDPAQAALVEQTLRSTVSATEGDPADESAQ